ncbi:FxSxx-COOH system tetratricopeptide repeat protein [Streptomyces sp. MUM 178J]|uniref:FxSxx-COOH system tetratricopeptide repeat protein n=1 Tax=Streptomyces sp. MUM 178J TaxID=2791991 RepID=UPI001F0431A3|nr:FxSxx-COOH system tetratricopeptide repeat protein [Streptomyces sp. MUM 178J]WRQ81130.1 FxSxx-COOH system tetratricopeptide repeat protein [Streptomyces sp. MUM 178J]
MVAERGPDGSEAPVQESEHFVVAFSGHDRAWATWIAHRLEYHGHRASLYRWDPSREQPLQEALSDLQLASGRVLLVLSDVFFQLGLRREGEWNAVLRGFVAQQSDRFAAVTLTNRPLLPATAVLEPADLWQLDEKEAERRLLYRLSLSSRPARRAAVSSVSRYPRNQPAAWGNVPRRNSRFTGRDEILNALQQRLMDAEPGAAVCALVGMAGIGKTQIAVEYAYRFLPDYDVVWWVNSDQRNTQRDTFAGLTTALGLPSGSEPGERIRVVRESLRRGVPYGRWLVIFDGWESPEDAAAYLPQGGAGHVLITSRNHNWRAATDTLEISGFRRAESTGYLLRRAPHITAEQADQVAVEFHDVPLQLAQAAAWLGESRMEVPEYLRMVRDGGLARFEGLVMPDDYPQSSLTSWSILINKLKRSERHTVELLTLCTAFAPGRIPLGLVRGLRASDLPENLRWITSDLPSWTRALDSLVNYSVLTRETRGSAFDETGRDEEAAHEHETVRMHGVVHAIVSELASGREREEYRKVVHRLLADADPGAPNDSKQWPRYAELLPHLSASGALDSQNQRVQNTLLNCLRYCFASGENRAGSQLAEQIRARWSQYMTADAPLMLSLTTLQGNVLRASSRFREAYELDHARLDRLRTAEHSNEHALLEATSCLAADTRFLGQYDKALRMQEEVVATAHRLFGAEERTTLLAQYNLATGLRLLGRYQEAYDVDLDTLRKREVSLRERHPDTLRSINTCARDLRVMGHYRDALARQELGMRLHVQVLGPQHPQTLWARHNLLLCQWRAGTSGEEIASAMAALLELQEQVHGRSHFYTLALIADYGSFLREHGELARAKELISEAENGYRQLLGQAHPVPTGMQSNAGLVLQAEGDRDGALSMFEQAMVGLRPWLGDDHPVMLGCALNTAAGRNFTGRLEDAAELSRNTLLRSRRVLGEDHPLTLSCMVALAADLRALQERDEAGKLEEDALQRLTRTLGAQHHHTLSARQRVRPYWDFEPYLG